MSLMQMEWAPMDAKILALATQYSRLKMSPPMRRPVTV